MKYCTNFSIMGGDTRTVRLAELLANDNHSVSVFALERGGADKCVNQCTSLMQAVSGAQCVVLPLPLLGNNGMFNTPLSQRRFCINEILSALDPKQFICAGRVSKETHELAHTLGLTIHDYYSREELIVANAVATAEGAIQLAMEETSITICASRCLVIGYGRIGKILSHRLRALGAHVSVSSRKHSDMEWCRAFGYEVLDTNRLDGRLGNFDIIINTVPALVLNENRLKELKSDCLCMDLASKPGGVDLTAAANLGVKVLWALSLPGEVAPVTSAAMIRSTIYNMLREEEWLL